VNLNYEIRKPALHSQRCSGFVQLFEIATPTNDPGIFISIGPSKLGGNVVVEMPWRIGVLAVTLNLIPRRIAAWALLRMF
jgi:hypothetical protein